MRGLGTVILKRGGLNSCPNNKFAQLASHVLIALFRCLGSSELDTGDERPCTVIVLEGLAKPELRKGSPGPCCITNICM